MFPFESYETFEDIDTHKTKDRVTRTPLKSAGELRCSGRVWIIYVLFNEWIGKGVSVYFISNAVEWIRYACILFNE